MAILINENTRILVQGITGNQGNYHCAQMLTYGSKVVGGTSPDKGGEKVHGIPVFNCVSEAAREVQPNAAAIFVPARFVLEASLEAMEAGIRSLVIITEHVPLHDAMEIMAYARQRQAEIIGPNTFGVISPGKSKIGIMPGSIFSPGPVGVVARSGTLSYEISSQLSNTGLGQSTVVGLGGDRIVGFSFTEILKKFETDPETRAVVLIGEIGGSAEEEAALYIREMTKPVVAFLAGKSAPPGKRMGHAGAIVERGRGSYESKVQALTQAGAGVAGLPWEVGRLVKEQLEDVKHEYL